VHDLSFEEHDKHVEEEQKRRRNLEQDADEDDLGVGDEEETEDILLLDPKEWKVSHKLSFLRLWYYELSYTFRNKIIMLSLGYRI
jgi:DnaJ family protein C protein 2